MNSASIRFVVFGLCCSIKCQSGQDCFITGQLGILQYRSLVTGFKWPASHWFGSYLIGVRVVVMIFQPCVFHLYLTITTILFWVLVSLVVASWTAYGWVLGFVSVAGLNTLGLMLHSSLSYAMSNHIPYTFPIVCYFLVCIIIHIIQHKYILYFLKVG